MLENKEAVIFDLDGTLVDSVWIWSVVDHRFLGEYGISVPGDISDDLEGCSFHETAIYFKKRFELDLSIQEIKAKWNHMATEIYTNEVPLKDGVIEFLEELKGRNMKIGISTSNSRELAMATLKTHNISDYFDYICTSNEVKKGKPAPDVYLKTAAELSIEPKRTLVFEDIPYGIMAGNSANMETCAVWDKYSEDVINEKKELANYYIQSYFDVLNGTYERL
ncbi:MAG: HAD family phosphatase [Anaerostipes sp.]|nr:HAD family phosphatase [Anaerostipes sp.]